MYCITQQYKSRPRTTYLAHTSTDTYQLETRTGSSLVPSIACSLAALSL
jgi:hypothetical protein